MFVGSGGSTSGDSCKTFMNDNQHASNSLNTHTVHWMTSVGTLWTPAGSNINQTISVPQHRSGLPETFQTRRKLIPQQCQNPPGSATHATKKDGGNLSAHITVKQANAQKFIISTNCVWGTGTNLSNQHANNLLKGTIQQDMSKGNGLSVPLFISTQKQMQQLQKKSNQHKRLLPKAIAIVTPLTQCVGSTAPKTHSTDNSPKLLVNGAKKSAFGSSHISIQMNVSQKVMSQSTSLMCQNVASENSNEPVKPSRKRLCSEPLENGTGERKKRTLSCSADEVSSTLRTPEPAEALDMQGEIEPPSQQPPIMVKEWSIKSLHHLINQLEQDHIQQLKEPCFSDLRTEILRLFWDGDYKQLFTANKNNLYLDIMLGVKHYCKQNNSVILTELPQETKPQMDHNFLILEHDHAPPKLEHQSSWLNLNKNLDDIDKEFGYSSLLLASSDTLKVVKEGLIKEQARVDGKTQRTPEHEINSSVLVEGVLQPACAVIINKNIQENISDHSPSEKQPKAISENTEANSANTEYARDSQVIHGDKSTLNRQTILFKYLMAEKLEKGSNPVQETFSSEKPHSPSSDPAEKTITEEFCETPQKVPDYETKKAADLVIESDTEQSLNAKCKNKSEHQKQTKIIFHYGKTCCLPRWFQTFGYTNCGHCVCKRALWIRQGNVTKNITLVRSVQSHTDSLDEIKIGEIITDSEEIQKLAAAKSLLNDVTLKHRFKKKKRRRKNRKLFTHDHTASYLLETMGQNPESRTKERIINLALFGSSSHQPATASRWTPKRLDHMPPPPQTLHIRVSSDFDLNLNSSTNLSTKDRILNSWRKSYVPTNIPGKRRSSKLRGAGKTKGASRTDLNLTTIRLIKARLKRDSLKPSTLPGKHNHLVQSSRQVEEAGKVKTIDSAVCNSSNKQNDVQEGKVRNSPDVQVQLHDDNTSSKEEKLNKDLLLNFNVLPESFSLIQGSSGKMEPCSKNNQGSNIKSASSVKPSLRPHDVMSIGAWHFNRKRKWPVDPTVSASESKQFSIFQQFKRRYEDKQRKLPS